MSLQQAALLLSEKMWVEMREGCLGSVGRVSFTAFRNLGLPQGGQVVSVPLPLCLHPALSTQEAAFFSREGYVCFCSAHPIHLEKEKFAQIRVLQRAGSPPKSPGC